MTVCIAAICNLAPPTKEPPTAADVEQQMIVGAADRMITAESVEYEPFQSKIYNFDTHALALAAGDMGLQIDICNATSREIMNRQTVGVEEIAQIYALKFSEHRRRIAERLILSPLGLTVDDFIARQQSFSPSSAAQVTRELQDLALGAETIIAGVDATGAHIYVVRDPGLAACTDSVGFAAIGLGQSHAESQFMLHGYSRNWPTAKALFLTYSAKRRAEIAPGVGTQTDLFFITREAGFTQVPDVLFQKFWQEYKILKDKETQAMTDGYDEVDQYVTNLLAQEAQTTPRGAEKKAEEDTAYDKTKI